MKMDWDRVQNTRMLQNRGQQPRHHPLPIFFGVFFILWPIFKAISIPDQSSCSSGLFYPLLYSSSGQRQELGSASLISDIGFLKTQPNNFWQLREGGFQTNEERPQGSWWKGGFRLDLSGLLYVLTIAIGLWVQFMSSALQYFKIYIFKLSNHRYYTS